jgi:UDP-3-O-[3-hydroxymyristoyl] N-acetylglucosamine deacetylase
MHRQSTLNDAIAFKGIGLHTGCPVEMILRPAPAQTGIVFRRTDLNNFPIEALAAHIANVSYATTLMKKGVLISTVEHVLSALYALGIDNAYIDLDNLEVPILDSSALPYVERILAVGRRLYDEPRRVLRIRREIHYALGEKTVSARPADDFAVTYRIDFTHPLIGVQQMRCVIDPEGYHREIAAGRTFGFLKEIAHLKENGLAQGGSLDNAIVLSDTGMLNPEGLRFPDEFIRHKILDFLGDFSLLGHLLRGEFHVVRGGHGVHAAMVKKILADPTNYTLETVSESVATEVA